MLTVNSQERKSTTELLVIDMNQCEMRAVEEKGVEEANTVDVSFVFGSLEKISYRLEISVHQHSVQKCEKKTLVFQYSILRNGKAWRITQPLLQCIFLKHL